MEKGRFLDFINRYHLGGEIEAAIWETKDGSLSTKFITGDKSMIGDVSVDNFNSFEDGVELGILTTGQLLKMSSVLPTSDVDLKLNKINNGDEVKYLSIDFIYGKSSLERETYMLAETDVIHRSKGLKETPKFHVSFDLSEEFIDMYIKSKSAMSETKIFTILKNKEGEYGVVLGYSQINTNRIGMYLGKNDYAADRPISFNADFLKNILTANKGAKSTTLEISYDGLAHIHVEDGDYTANYYLVEAETDA